MSYSNLGLFARSARMATGKRNKNDVNLPFAALRLLAPPVRVVSAAVWKVMKQRDVLQYGVVEEFISSACETVPGLLTVRHQGKLTLGLRARLILELCCTQPDIKVVEPHMKRICTSDLSLPAPAVTNDIKVINAAKKFESLVHTLLTNPTMREQFFKEEFPVEYGPIFDQALEKLLWEFLIRLDQLLPVPNLAQTVSWLSDAPPVLEECARAATQPQLLKLVLQHQSRLGHLEPAGSLPPNMGDTVLDSLSLPLSGKVASAQPTKTKMSAVDQSVGAQTRDTPVIGILSIKDAPVVISSSKNVGSSKDVTNKKVRFAVGKQKQKSKHNEAKQGEEHLQEEAKSSKRTMEKKRRHPDQRQSESDEEHEVTICEKNRAKRFRSDPGTARSKPFYLPEEPSLCSLYLSCMNRQPRVIAENLSLTSVSALCKGTRGQCSPVGQQERRKSPVKTTSNQHQESDTDLSDLEDKENHQLAGISSSPSQQRSNTEMLSDDREDYVADSEDEVTKNFKGRLFLKRYYKTKHGTYVPTLREFWKPAMTRRNQLSVGTNHR